jgi:hypothetical protein
VQICAGWVPDPTSMFPFLYVNIVAGGTPKFFKTMAPGFKYFLLQYSHAFMLQLGMPFAEERSQFFN